MTKSVGAVRLVTPKGLNDDQTQSAPRLGDLITGFCRCGDFLAFAASRCQYSARSSHIALWPTSSAKSASLWHASAFMRCWAASSAISLLALLLMCVGSQSISLNCRSYCGGKAEPHRRLQASIGIGSKPFYRLPTLLSSCISCWLRGLRGNASSRKL